MASPAPDPPSLGEVHHRAHSGEDLGRVFGLSDGIFAFALTLLVLQLTVPAAVCAGTATSPAPSASQCSVLVNQALAHEYTSFIYYAEAFIIIGVWWVIHHRQFRFIGRYDGRLVAMNLAFLGTIAIAPFVLGLYLNYPDTVAGSFLFATEQAAAGFLLLALWVHAERRGLLNDDADGSTRRYIRLRGTLLPSCFAVGMAVALVAPAGVQFVWLAALVVSFSVRRWVG